MSAVHPAATMLRVVNSVVPEIRFAVINPLPRRFLLRRATGGVGLLIFPEKQKINDQQDTEEDRRIKLFSFFISHAVENQRQEVRPPSTGTLIPVI